MKIQDDNINNHLSLYLLPILLAIVIIFNIKIGVNTSGINFDGYFDNPVKNTSGKIANKIKYLKSNFKFLKLVNTNKKIEMASKMD